MRTTPSNETADDLTLIQRYREHNDGEAMEILLRRYSDMAYRTALRHLRNPDDAQDAVQTAFAKVMQGLDRYRGEHSFAAWAMKIVIGTCIDMIRTSARRRVREQRVAEEAGEPVETSLSGTTDLTAAIRQVLADLPERYRLPIQLHHGEGLAFRGVASVLSVSEGAVRMQTSRGLEMVRERLARSGVAVPAASIVAAISELPTESAPAALVESLRDLVRGTGDFAREALAARGMDSEGPGRIRLAKAAGIAGGLAAVVGTGFWLSGPRAPGPREAGSVAAPAIRPTVADAETVDYRWDFNGGIPAEMKLSLGAWHHVPDGGPDGSGCIETDEEFVRILIEVPIRSLPVVVTYRHSAILPEPKDQFMTGVSWQSRGPLAQFKGIGTTPRAEPMPNGKQAKWVWSSDYITPDAIQYTTSGQLTAVCLGQRIGDSRLKLLLRGRHRIDDLQIRSIAASQVPDAARYVEAVERIPPAERVGTVAIPGLKPGPRFKEVTVTFFPAQP